MEGGPLRDLREMAWFQRNLDAGVGALHLDEHRLIAGDWDGDIHCWDLEGELLWNATTSNRVSGFALGGNLLFAVCGRDIVCLELTTGETHWTVELEGSSDLVACTPDGTIILATSSIFDLEMNDFLESTFWRFNAEGELLRQDSINERPWSIEMRKDGIAFLPLGRPRCGMIRATEEGLHHTPLPTTSPATCGSLGRNHLVIGHADGTLTAIDDGMVMDDDTYTNQPGTIGSISVAEQGFLVAISIEQGAVGAGFGGAEGLARAYDRKGSLLWQMETPLGCNIEHVTFGPTINSNISAWVISWDNHLSTLDVRTIPGGDAVMTVQMNSRVNVIIGNLEYLAIGLDDGSLYLLQGELLTRRLESETSSTVDEHRSTMAEKLRRLRS
jgi:WD40 repeat protein